MARLVVVSNRVAVPKTGTRAGGLEVASALGVQAPSRHLVRLERTRRASKGLETQDHRGRQHFLCRDRPAEGGLRRILQRLRQPRAVADPALPARSRRILAPRSLRLSARQRAFRRRTAESPASRTTSIWVHDYHFLPFAKALRERGHKNRIGFFLHIPFPPPEIITALPHHERIISALCHYDLVGFQTEIDAANFARYLETECRYAGNRERRFRHRRAARADRRVSGRRRSRAVQPPGAALVAFVVRRRTC